MKKIPESAIEVQTGLWANLASLIIKDNILIKYDLYAEEGYCFYLSGEQSEEGKTYYKFMHSVYSSIEQINENIISIPAYLAI